MRRFIEDFIYVMIWSVGLLYGSFHKVFEGTQNYLFCNMNLHDAVQSYVFPMIMAMLLYLFDVIYGILRDSDEGRQTNVLCLLVLLCLFLAGFLMPLLYNNLAVAVAGFWIAWVSLSFMKLVSTYHVGISSNPRAMLPDND